MKIRHFLLIGALMPVIASCSRPEALMDEPAESSPVKMTFKVSADLLSRSRATTEVDDPVPTRAFMYIRDNAASEPIAAAKLSNSENGQFQFSLELDRSHTYTIAFWADCGGYNIDAAKGLEKISYDAANTTAPLIAYAKCESAFKPTENTYDIVLQHAVAKLIIRETGTLKAGDHINVSFARSNYQYSAVSGTYTPTPGNTQLNLTHNVTDSRLTGDMITTYMLAPNEEHKANDDPSMMVNALKITYTPSGESKSHEQTISSVSFKANYRTVIAGNIMSLSKVAQSFSVFINNNWNDMPSSGIGEDDDPGTPDDPGNENPPSGNAPVITLNVAGSLTDDMLVNNVGDGNALRITGPMNDKDFNTLCAYLSADGNGGGKQLSLDLQDASFASLPALAFCHYESLDKGYNKDNPNPVTGLGEIRLPDGLTSIPDGAFADCVNLKTIRVPSSVTTIGEMAFYRSGITSLNAPSVESVEGSACEGCHALTTVVLGNLKEIYDYSFRHCESLTTFDITRCMSAPRAGNQIFGDPKSTTFPDLTVCVANQAIYDALKTDTLHWSGSNIKCIIGYPTD